MKRIKKLAALALAVMMLMSLTVTAYAADGDTDTYEVVINNAEGHTYKIYQIFTGDLSTKKVDGEDVDVLSNIKYGENYGTEGEEVSEEDLNNFDPATVTPTGEGKALTTNGNTATIDGLVAGYYMVVDTTTNLPAGEAPSAIMFQVVGKTEINSKHPKTTIVKKVQDINDTTGAYTYDDKGNDWIDSADYDIGDTVPFKSTATFTGLSNYDTYKVIFTDTMAKGLTYNRDMTVSVNGEDKTSAFTIATAACTDTDGDYAGGTVITVTCDDITALIDEGVNDAEIVLNYTATLNSEAKLGAAGNPNKIKVTTKPDGTGETTEDVNIVFTFKVDVNKYTTIDKAEVALPGAGFTLYKEVKNSATEGAKTGSAIKTELRATNPSIKADALNDDAYYVVAAKVEVDATGAIFGFKGIDDGNYVLVETTIPAGYNAWDAEEFTVEATHDVVSATPALNTLTGGDLLTGDVESGILSGKVENKSGTVLPETGGIGTTIFYVLGATMVLVAVVLLVTKKRMASGE